MGPVKIHLNAWYQPSPGFTLLELLVVLVVIGVMAGAMTLSLGRHGQADQLEKEATRLRALLALASEEAILQGRILQLEVQGQGYAFSFREGKKWVTWKEDRLFAPHALPPPIEAKLEGEEPTVFLLPSGEMSPFNLLLRLPTGTAYRLSATLTGQLDLAGPFQETE